MGPWLAQIVNCIYSLCMIPRVLTPVLIDRARTSPAVALTGPRQSGKTTLCRAAFPDHRYVSLEPLDVRDYAVSDPRGFLAEQGPRVIFDEVQRAPSLFSYLQEEIDRDPRPGRFILTGSQHFGLSDAIAQSLAGRVAVLHLLPLSLDELWQFEGAPRELWSVIWAGGYPRIHDRGLDAGQWLGDYTATYVQRDVRQVLRIVDLQTFGVFLRLLAGRTAQEENLSTLGADAGVSHPTVRAWLSVLEASFVVFRLPRWHRNLRKRPVKAAKQHFLDTGLACHLLGINSPDQLRLHPLRGALFESWVASEILKARVHAGMQPHLHHMREARGVELDVIVDDGSRIIGVEAKSAATLASDFFTTLREFNDTIRQEVQHVASETRLVYGGTEPSTRSGVRVVPWSAIQDIDW
jgi:predicted AAA+ superfamily ATPase